MKILVTRPINQSENLAKKVINLGYDPVIAPLLEIHYIKDIDLQSFEQFDVIVITSSNALTAIANANKNLKLFIVGKHSTNYAKSLGFVNSVYAGQDVLS